MHPKYYELQLIGLLRPLVIPTQEPIFPRCQALKDLGTGKLAEQSPWFGRDIESCPLRKDLLFIPTTRSIPRSLISISQAELRAIVTPLPRILLTADYQMHIPMIPWPKVYLLAHILTGVHGGLKLFRGSRSDFAFKVSKRRSIMKSDASSLIHKTIMDYQPILMQTAITFRWTVTAVSNHGSRTSSACAAEKYEKKRAKILGDGTIEFEAALFVFTDTMSLRICRRPGAAETIMYERSRIHTEIHHLSNILDTFELEALRARSLDGTSDPLSWTPYLRVDRDCKNLESHAEACENAPYPWNPPLQWTYLSRAEPHDKNPKRPCRPDLPGAPSFKGNFHMLNPARDFASSDRHKLLYSA
ncbi:uncharacterized protein BT62DRAFT_1079810 [Guyanagaster necrorhizus]|uniref:Uncharacterized protein n=1 Tax=Guyanagaster necrorhizus TaxID=856835 RepID=A0A9P7VJY1_9AGAR|nr:uncharacterized protein BT62DRAFT_1079810 [Guyanagaster necrorhizus MCA 3950]KAG7441867.1 hypothetical protein BT62DRAFT_1079810 [Guyanagaster necrorhizus MCA 3950]